MTDFEHDWKLARSIEGWLQGRGYDVIETRGPEGMAQGLIRHRGPSAGILIVADRLQWVVDVRPHGAPAGRYDFECWSIALGAPVSFHTDDWDLLASWQLAPQLVYLRSHLTEIEAASEPARLVATLAKLREGAAATAAFPPTSSDIARR